jgi:putative tryptophan/tyrosine transport system substrate-binding protein
MAIHIRRRDFVATLGGAAAAGLLAARAQQRTMLVVGYLDSASASRDRIAAFQRGLNEQGFVDGRNVAIEYRWADNRYDRLPDLANDLIRHRVAVVVASTAPAALAMKALDTTIPIVFGTSLDPVQSGLVQSLNRPGGNLTGFTDMASDLAGKQLGLLHELLPAAARFALLVDPAPLGTAERWIAEINSAASAIGIPLEVLRARDSGEIDATFAMLAQNQKRADALVVANQTLFVVRRIQLVTFAARHALPAIYSEREYAEAGGLMTYGSSFSDRQCQLGIYTGRILKGEKPSDLPVLRASKFEFVVNLQTAKVIGLDVPPTLIARADEIIE